MIQLLLMSFRISSQHSAPNRPHHVRSNLLPLIRFPDSGRKECGLLPSVDTSQSMPGVALHDRGFPSVIHRLFPSGDQRSHPTVPVDTKLYNVNLYHARYTARLFTITTNYTQKSVRMHHLPSPRIVIDIPVSSMPGQCQSKWYD